MADQSYLGCEVDQGRRVKVSASATFCLRTGAKPVLPTHSCCSRSLPHSENGGFELADRYFKVLIFCLYTIKPTLLKIQFEFDKGTQLYNYSHK